LRIGVVVIQKKILLITHSIEAYAVIKKQLEDLFSTHIEIISLSTKIKPEVIQLVIATFKHKCIDDFPREKVIFAKRTIQISVIEKLMSLPRMATCYVASNTYDASVESINMLKAFGIQLQLLPYPEAEDLLDKEVSIAITHDSNLINTSNFATVIEIGIRPIDFSTIVEIAIYLQIPIQTHSVYKATNMDEIVRLNRHLLSYIQEVRSMNQQMEAIFHTSQDGLITVDSKGIIVQANKAIQYFLQNQFELSGRKLAEVFPTQELLDNQEHYLYTINGYRLVVQVLSMSLPEGEEGRLMIFREVDKLQKAEIEVRRKIHTKGFVSKYKFSDVVGHSQILKETIERAKRLAANEQPLLILGKNGTGKELFAHSVHHVSSRKEQPFVPINFAGLPETLAESELFGYEEGAFTGAKKGGQPGFFELAHNGTIFLDEIGDASLAIQASLLRVIQEKQIIRVGGRRIIPINVRIIAATNKDLEKLVKEGKFREDLFYRINVLPLCLPDLNSRKEDILPLVEYYFEKLGLHVLMEADVKKRFIDYSWPGNVRELENTVYYLSAIVKENRIRIVDLPEKFFRTSEKQSAIIGILESEGNLVDFLDLLTYLQTAKQNKWPTGRNAIEAHFKRGGTKLLTSQQIKSRMAVLKKYELVNSGATKQGTWITKYGIDTLGALKDYLG
jgi:transcriptional regulator with PAS, ATPase and Fis domain